MSEKKKRQLAEEGPVVQRALARDHFECQFLARIADAGGSIIGPLVDCHGRIDPHHIIPRGRGGPTTMENLVSLCRAHHDWVDANMELAEAVGLLASLPAGE